MVKKLVYEVGLIRDGLPIVRRQYFESEELRKADPVIVSSFLSAIQDFTKSTFADLPQEFRMAKYIACLHKIECFEGGILYAICEAKADSKKIRKSLLKVANLLSNAAISWHEKLTTSNIDTRVFEKFHSFFDNEFIPLNQDYADKLKKRLSSF